MTTLQTVDMDATKPQMDVGTRLAFQRTYLALERTQMAWVRTALSLVTFGFTIAKFFEYLREQKGQAATLFGPTTVGILMISSGLAALGATAVLHARATRILRAECPDLPPSLSTMMAAVLGIVGFFALASAVLR